MSATTVFRDRLGAGLSFPIGLGGIDEALTAERVAAYFVNQSTWLRQAVPLNSPRLPVLRLQRYRPSLRVANERVTALPHEPSLYALVYAVPSTVRPVARALLASNAGLLGSRAASTGGRLALLVLVSPQDQSLSIEDAPSWW
jgi:hypothetical protein